MIVKTYLFKNVKDGFTVFHASETDVITIEELVTITGHQPIATWLGFKPMVLVIDYLKKFMEREEYINVFTTRI